MNAMGRTEGEAEMLANALQAPYSLDISNHAAGG